MILIVISRFVCCIFFFLFGYLASIQLLDLVPVILLFLAQKITIQFLDYVHIFSILNTKR